LKDDSALEGCMSGRMAYQHSIWDIARIDTEVYGDVTKVSMNREDILKNYADFCQE